MDIATLVDQKANVMIEIEVFVPLLEGVEIVLDLVPTAIDIAISKLEIGIEIAEGAVFVVANRGISVLREV